MQQPLTKKLDSPLRPNAYEGQQVEDDDDEPELVAKLSAAMLTTTDEENSGPATELVLNPRPIRATDIYLDGKIGYLFPFL